MVVDHDPLVKLVEKVVSQHNITGIVVKAPFSRYGGEDVKALQGKA